MLGDLSAERYSLKGNTRLRFFMSIKNKDYIMHLYSMFSEYVLTPPKEMVRKKINKLTGKLQTDIAFSTLKYSIFNWTMEDFYVKVENKNIKFVPAKANENLTAVSLAYWIMDDGSYNKIKGCLILCTDSYSKEDVSRLISILKDKFNLSCGIIKNIQNEKIYYRIRINKSSLSSLILLIKPYLIPSMYYKVGLN